MGAVSLFRYAFGFALLIGASGPLLAQEVTRVISLQPVCDQKNTYRVLLTNASDKNLVTQVQALPWSINSWSMKYRIFFIANGKTNIVRNQHVLADYFGQKSAAPHAILTGTLHLESVVPSLDALRSSGDVIVYWSFDFERLMSPLSQWKTSESGLILLPKKGFFSDGCGGVLYDNVPSN